MPQASGSRRLRAATPLAALVAAVTVAAGCGGPFTNNPFLGGPVNFGGGIVRPLGGGGGMGEGWSALVGVPVSSTRDVNLAFESLYDEDDWTNRVSIEFSGLNRYYTWESGWFWRLGWTAHWDEFDNWGTGPRASAGYCSFYLLKGHMGIEAVVGVYGWLGEKDGKFNDDIVFEGGVNLSFRLGRRSVW